MHSVTKEVINSKTCAGILHRGPYHEIGPTFGKFFSLLHKSKDPAKMSSSGSGSGDCAGTCTASTMDGKTLGLFLDNPQTTKPEDLRSYAAVDITNEVDRSWLPKEFETIQVSGGPAAVMTVKGSCTQLGEAWESFGGRIASEGWKPSTNPDCISQQINVEMDYKDESKNITKLVMFLEDE